MSASAVIFPVSSRRRRPGNLAPMEHSADTNAAIWHSAEAVQAWSAEAERQNAPGPRTGSSWPGCCVRSGAGVHVPGPGRGDRGRRADDLAGASGSAAILADFSAEMMRAGQREMEPFAGRYRYVEFDCGRRPVARGDPRGAGRGGDFAVRPPPARRAQAVPVRRDLQPAGPGGLVPQLRPVSAEDPVVAATWHG